MLSRRFIHFGLATVVLAGVGTISADEPLKGEAHDSTELRQLLSDLSKENQSLKDEVARLKQKVKELQSCVIIQTPPGAGARQVPDNWVPHQFNGVTYYIVPLNADRGRATSSR